MKRYLFALTTSGQDNQRTEFFRWISLPTGPSDELIFLPGVHYDNHTLSMELIERKNQPKSGGDSVPLTVCRPVFSPTSKGKGEVGYSLEKSADNSQDLSLQRDLVVAGWTRGNVYEHLLS